MLDDLFTDKIDAYIIFNPINRFYFTGFSSSAGCVVLTKNEKLFFVDSRYAVEAQQISDARVITVRASELYQHIKTELAKLDVKKIGFEDKYITVYEHKFFKTEFTDFKLVGASDKIEAMRMIKSDDEIALISEAQQIAQRALKKIIPTIKAGITERELASELNYECLLGGADSMSFATIVAFGENTAVPHHAPSNRKFEKNDLILIDFGVKYRGYCSDMTRTFCLNEPKDELKVIHDIVLQAQSYALKHIKAGMTVHEADSLAREYIRANGYEKEFSHSLGHGLGLEIHEPPRLGEFGEGILKPGMVVTIEPGIYVENIGGVRIEDIVVIREDGIENLTNFDKNIEI